MRKRFGLLTLVGVIAAGLLTAAALAIPPDHHTDSEDYSGGASCGAFTDLYEGHLDASGITKFDKQGNPVAGRRSHQRLGTQLAIRPAKRVVHVEAEFHRALRLCDRHRVGHRNHLIDDRSGHGVLFHDVGNIQFNDGTGEVIAIHGPHDVFDQGDAAYCNALLAIS